MLSWLIGTCSSRASTEHGHCQPLTNRPTAPGCIFCHASADNGFDIVHEDDIFIAFRDHNPSSLHHIQLIPKRHIASVTALRRSDVDFVKSMEALGHTILDNLGVAPHMRKLGFHIPPFNTVHHLHLHLQGLPYKSFARRMKYPIIDGGKRFAKGLSWFVDVKQVVKILEAGKRVGVLPS